MQRKTLDAFIALLRAGLWEQGVRLACFGAIDFNEIRRVASDEGVLGLVTAGRGFEDPESDGHSIFA